MSRFSRVAGLSGTLERGLRRGCRVLPIIVLRERVSRVSNAGGFLFHLCSKGMIRDILVGCGRKGSIYVSSRINYEVKYTFYTSAVKNLIEGLSPSRVLKRVCRVRGVDNREISGMIVVKANRPVSGCSGFLGFVRLLASRRKLGVDREGIAMSAYKVIPGVGRLTGRRLRVALTLSLRNSGRRGQEGLVPITGGCSVARMLTTYSRCFGRANQEIDFRCDLIRNIGSASRSTRRLVRLLGRGGYRVGLVPIGPMGRHSFIHPDQGDTLGFGGGLRGDKVGIAVEERVNSSVSKTYNRLEHHCMRARKR